MKHIEEIVKDCGELMRKSPYFVPEETVYSILNASQDTEGNWQVILSPDKGVIYAFVHEAGMNHVHCDVYLHGSTTSHML